jgi:hypothetical protein
MSDVGRFEHLRGSAQELLDAGNSAAAVAEVLSVPRSVVARWHEEPPPASAVDTVAVERARSGRIHFRTTLTLTAPLRFRAWHYGLALLASADAVAEVFIERSHAGLAAVNLLLVLVFAAGLARHLGLSRMLLTLGPDAAIVPGLWRQRRLPYPEMADYWLVSVARGLGDDEVEGRLLTLHSRRAGVRPIEVFVDDRFPIDPAMIERLDLVKKTNKGVQPLTPIADIPKA